MQVWVNQHTTLMLIIGSILVAFSIGYLYFTKDHHDDAVWILKLFGTLLCSGLLVIAVWMIVLFVH